MQKQAKINIAIDELGIKLNPHYYEQDRIELGEIIIDILEYPILQEAELHTKANQIGNYDLIAEQHQLAEQIKQQGQHAVRICPCCGMIVNQQPIEYLTNFNQIKIGIGVRLYFMSLLYSILTFSIGLFLYSIYTIATNVHSSDADNEHSQKLCLQDKQCSTSNIGIGSKLYSSKDFLRELMIQSVLGLVFIIVWGIVNIIKTYKEKQIEAQCKKHSISASDFTLMIENVPKGFIEHPEQQVFENIQQIFKEYEKQVKSLVSYEIIKVNIAYPLYNKQKQQIQLKSKLDQEIFQHREIFRQWLHKRKTTDYFQLSEQARNDQYQLFYDFLVHNYNKSEIDRVELNEQNIIFVTMRYSKARQQIQQNNKTLGCLSKVCLSSLCLNSKGDVVFPLAKVKISRAPEPNEIIWQNIGFTEQSKVLRKVLIYLMALVLILGSLTITFFLGTYQVNNNIYSMSIIISLVITTVNYIIQFIIIMLSYYENQFVKSKEEASIGIKIGLGQILNVIGVPIALTYISDKAIFTSGGLVTDVFYIGLFNMILPIGRLIDPFNILLKVRQKYYSSAEKKLSGSRNQMEFNKLFTFYEFELGYQYAYIIKTGFFTAFFMPLQPIIAVFAPIGLILMYLTNKYKVLYRFQKPKFNFSSVNTFVQFFMTFAPVAFAFGQLFFINFQTNSNQLNLIVNWITAGFSILYLLIPFQRCFALFHTHYDSGYDYEEKQIYLSSDYDRSNPITRQNAIQTFKQYIKHFEKKYALPEKSQIIKTCLIDTKKNLSSLKNISAFRNISAIGQKNNYKRSNEPLTELESDDRHRL